MKYKITKWSRILTEEFLIEEYSKNKKTTYKIADKIGCSNVTVLNYLKKFNIPIRTKKEAGKLINRKGKNNPSYIDGRTHKIYYCKDCLKEISIKSAVYGKGRCQDCNYKFKVGENAIGYKHGESLKQYYCIDCGKEITYKSERCPSCSGKLKWKDEKFKEHFKKLWENVEFKEKAIKARLQGKKISPNIPEKTLIKLLKNILPNQYKFIGDGKLIIGGYCPDFINTNGQKKIIEHFGCYWHKCKQCGFGKGKLRPKDAGRLKEYNKLGYQTLIVWEHELKNLDKVSDRILEFNRPENVFIREG